MEMDPIEYLLQQSQKKLSLSIFINAHSRLSIVQMNKGSISFEDLMQNLTLSITAEMSSNELNGYAGCIYEACFSPFMSPKGPLLRLSTEIVGNDANFLKAVLKTLYSRADSSCAAAIVNDFKYEASCFLKKSNNNANDLLDILAPNFDAVSPSLSTNSGRDIHSDKCSSVSSVKSPSPRMRSFSHSMFLETLGAEIEKHELLVPLLANLRKPGMDIMFPQEVHDKVRHEIICFSSAYLFLFRQILMSIYVAIKLTAPLRHRELIDVVVAVKESRILSQLDNVSRTKIRGVLALLKHAQLFVIQGDEGEAVRLHLSSGINSFNDFRDKHDLFINHCILQNRLFIPVALKGELVWQLEPQLKTLRLEEMKSTEQTLERFFTNGTESHLRATSTKNVHAPSTPTFLNEGNNCLQDGVHNSSNGSPLSGDGGGFITCGYSTQLSGGKTNFIEQQHPQQPSNVYSGNQTANHANQSGSRWAHANHHSQQQSPDGYNNRNNSYGNTNGGYGNGINGNSNVYVRQQQRGPNYSQSSPSYLQQMQQNGLYARYIPSAQHSHSHSEVGGGNFTSFPARGNNTNTKVNNSSQNDFLLLSSSSGNAAISMFGQRSNHPRSHAFGEGGSDNVQFSTSSLWNLLHLEE
jgi:hypothetical protein